MKFSGHLFRHCKRAKEVWLASDIELETNLLEIHEFMDLVWYARNVKQMTDQALAQLFMTAWGIWSNRNEIQTGGSRKSASLIASWTKDYLEEFQVANLRVKLKQLDPAAGWFPPHPSWYKINVDGAIFENLREVGIGVIIRDHFGSVTAALSKKIQAPLGPLETEAKIMEEGMQFAWDMGIRSAIFEGDLEVAFHSLLGSATPPTSISNIISGSLLQAQRFSDCKFSLVPWDGNKAAQGLAQYARNLSKFSFWIEETLFIIEHLVSRCNVFILVKIK